MASAMPTGKEMDAQVEPHGAEIPHADEKRVVRMSVWILVSL